MAVHSLPAERRQQRGMNIQNPMSEIFWDAQQLQEAGQADKLGARTSTAIKYTLAEVLNATRRFPGDNLDRQACIAGTRDASHILFTGDDLNDANRKVARRPDVNEILQRGAAPTEKDGNRQFKRLIHG